jgi:transcriptional regulator with XRE-family HTH domain
MADMDKPAWVQTEAQEARHEAGLTLRRLHELTGIHSAILSLWERGRYNLTFSEVQRISEAIETAKKARAA